MLHKDVKRLVWNLVYKNVMKELIDCVKLSMLNIDFKSKCSPHIPNICKTGKFWRRHTSLSWALNEYIYMSDLFLHWPIYKGHLLPYAISIINGNVYTAYMEQSKIVLRLLYENSNYSKVREMFVKNM